MEQRAQAILSHTPKLSVHDSRSLLRILVPPKAAGIAVFVAAGCSFADIKKAGFSLAEAKAAGCDLASAKAAGYDIPSLVTAFGVAAVSASGCDLRHFLVSCALAMHKNTFSN
jgi:hypothetical protein